MRRIQARVARACERAGRGPSEVEILGATKSVPAVLIEEAAKAGLMLIGENKVQEAQRKKGEVKSQLSWHMIGPLQRNKAALACRLFDVIQSVDREALCEKLELCARDIGKIQDVLMEVNISGEEQKSGVSPKNLRGLIEKAQTYKHLRILGLMAMAPYSENPEKARPYFREMKKLFDELPSHISKPHEARILSMGMTGDFEVAIEEGSAMIRIGTGIFGRPHPAFDHPLPKWERGKR